jgi:hypothetical protein
MAYEPKHLRRWTMPECYAGEVWPNFYSAGVGQSRDSDALERSNFRSMLKALGGESETVIVVREGHWAVGWVEWLAIHQDDERALAIADEIAERLESYPVVNEDDWSGLEWDEACEYWEGMSLRTRIEYCARAGLSIFAARRDFLPPDDSGALYELLTAA